jgi:hypothetical protein
MVNSLQSTNKNNKRNCRKELAAVPVKDALVSGDREANLNYMAVQGN